MATHTYIRVYIYICIYIYIYVAMPRNMAASDLKA